MRLPWLKLWLNTKVKFQAVLHTVYLRVYTGTILAHKSFSLVSKEEIGFAFLTYFLKNRFRELQFFFQWSAVYQKRLKWNLSI